MGQLQCLSDEFNFSDTASAQLHVEAAPSFHLVIDLLLCQPDAREGGTNRNLRPKNLRRNRVFETRKQSGGTSRCTRSNQRLALPILSALLVIAGGLVKRTGQGSVAPKGTQTQVNAIRGSLAARFSHQAD